MRSIAVGRGRLGRKVVLRLERLDHTEHVTNLINQNLFVVYPGVDSTPTLCPIQLDDLSIIVGEAKMLEHLTKSSATRVRPLQVYGHSSSIKPDIVYLATNGHSFSGSGSTAGLPSLSKVM
jgi:hypothetical protein